MIYPSVCRVVLRDASFDPSTVPGRAVEAEVPSAGVICCRDRSAVLSGAVNGEVMIEESQRALGYLWGQSQKRSHQQQMQRLPMLAMNTRSGRAGDYRPRTPWHSAEARHQPGLSLLLACPRAAGEPAAVGVGIVRCAAGRAEWCIDVVLGGGRPDRSQSLGLWSLVATSHRLPACRTGVPKQGGVSGLSARFPVPVRSGDGAFEQQAPADRRHAEEGWGNGQFRRSGRMCRATGRATLGTWSGRER